MRRTIWSAGLVVALALSGIGCDTQETTPAQAAGTEHARDVLDPGAAADMRLTRPVTVVNTWAHAARLQNATADFLESPQVARELARYVRPLQGSGERGNRIRAATPEALPEGSFMAAFDVYGRLVWVAVDVFDPAQPLGYERPEVDAHPDIEAISRGSRLAWDRYVTTEDAPERMAPAACRRLRGEGECRVHSRTLRLVGPVEWCGSADGGVCSVE